MDTSNRVPGNPVDHRIELLEAGEVENYADERIFGGKIESLDLHISRKKALAQKTRYSILYLIYEHGEITRSQVSDYTGRDGNALQHHLRSLIDTNLIAEISAPEDADGRETYYRITTLGRQEIEADLRNIHDSVVSKERYGGDDGESEVAGKIEKGMRETIEIVGSPNRPGLGV